MITFKHAFKKRYTTNTKYMKKTTHHLLGFILAVTYHVTEKSALACVKSDIDGCNRESGNFSK